MRSKCRADAKESAGTPQESVTTNIMHERKRVKLISPAFGKEKVRFIDLSDAYRHVRMKMEMRDEREFDTLQTPEAQKTRSKTTPRRECNQSKSHNQHCFVTNNLKCLQKSNDRDHNDLWTA